MKSKLLLLSIITLVIGVTACKQKENAEQTNLEITSDNSQNSLDWTGTYSGILPCADCAGIFLSLDLASDNTYKMEQIYQGKGDGEVYRSSGKFTWSADGNSINLTPNDENEFTGQFKVGEDQLVALDNDGKEITGDLAPHYILTKVNKDLVEKYWKLTELMGQPVTYNEGQAQEAFMTFKTEGNRVHGNFGCNTFTGSYELKPGNRITFSQMATTMMLCLDMDTESKFSEVLQQADNYNLDGDKLVLNKARMAPLARFEAVYM